MFRIAATVMQEMADPDVRDQLAETIEAAVMGAAQGVQMALRDPAVRGALIGALQGKDLDDVMLELRNIAKPRMDDFVQSSATDGGRFGFPSEVFKNIHLTNIFGAGDDPASILPAEVRRLVSECGSWAINEPLHTVRRTVRDGERSLRVGGTELGRSELGKVYSQLLGMVSLQDDVEAGHGFTAEEAKALKPSAEALGHIERIIQPQFRQEMMAKADELLQRDPLAITADQRLAYSKAVSMLQFQFSMAHSAIKGSAPPAGPSEG